MGTSGFWGIQKNGIKKLIYSNFDSYPKSLGKDTVFIIQNGLKELNEIFDKIILVDNVNILENEYWKYILDTPAKILDSEIKEKYYAEDAGQFLKKNVNLEYGYLINFDENILELFRNNKKIGEINLDKVNYKKLIKIFSI